MSKRYNAVTLDGVLTVHEVDTIVLNDVPTITLESTCNTNEPGGSHRVFAYARQAVETIAFAAVAQCDDVPLEVTIRGYLWSNNGISATVADEIVFHVARSSRSESVSLFRQLVQNEKGVTKFSFRNQSMRIEDLLHLISKPGPSHIKAGGRLKAVHINVSERP